MGVWDRFEILVSSLIAGTWKKKTNLQPQLIGSSITITYYLGFTISLQLLQIKQKTKVLIWYLNPPQPLSVKTLKFLLANFCFSGWVSNSEERKSIFKNSYLRMLVRVAESLCFGGSASVSGSVSAYARSGLVSIFVSGSDSTISPMII
jgi:hypothetical protein